MTDEVIEMDEAGELRTRLQFVEHDLQHVVQERNRAKDALEAVTARHRALREAVEKLIAFYDRHEYSTLNVDDLRAVLTETEQV